MAPKSEMHPMTEMGVKLPTRFPCESSANGALWMLLSMAVRSFIETLSRSVGSVQATMLTFSVPWSTASGVPVKFTELDGPLFWWDSGVNVYPSLAAAMVTVPVKPDRLQLPF